jgi:uncharacterized protein YndB with AHSA1/START domain
MERSVTHSTFTIERGYPASRERVFAAFSDPAKKRRWFAEGEEAPLENFQMDFRVGGFEHTRRCSKEGWVFTNDTVYRDIVAAERIVFAYNMSIGERCISSSLVTVEFRPSGEGTSLLFTEQAAFFAGADGPQIRETGWRLLLERLAEEFAQ